MPLFGFGNKKEELDIEEFLNSLDNEQIMEEEIDFYVKPISLKSESFPLC